MATSLDPGREDWWLRRSPLPRHGGPFLYRNHRRRPPSTMSALLALFAELYRRDDRPGSPSPFAALIAGAVPLPKRIGWALRHRGPAARRSFDRGYLAQATDMLRAWWATGLAPRDYYHALLARHRGGQEIHDYLRIHALDQIVIELQLDRYGPPAFRVNDKGAFAAWAGSNGVEMPETVLVETGCRPRPDDLDRLGPALVAKPRENALGHKVELWARSSDGMWAGEDRAVSTPELVDWFGERAEAEPPGIVLQEKLVNHPELAAVVGKSLSTCRVVTLRDESDEPEIVQFIWRTPGAGAFVDNFNGGGIHWGARDLEHGVVLHGVSRDTGSAQATHTHHPDTSAEMVGRAHPRWTEVRELALRGHRTLGDMLLVGWDIATTPTGPVAIELNVPPGSYPDTHMVTDGIARSRYGEILAWHARRWLEQHVPEGSPRRVGPR